MWVCGALDGRFPARTRVKNINIYLKTGQTAELEKLPIEDGDLIHRYNFKADTLLEVRGEGSYRNDWFVKYKEKDGWSDWIKIGSLEYAVFK